MRILFVTHPYPNYVPDLLLHGLRKLMGPAVVDFPRKDCLYEGVLGLGVCPPDQRCPGWFPDDRQMGIDRDDIWAKLRRGFFDMVVCDIRAYVALKEKIEGIDLNLVLIDGEDRPVPIHPGPYVVCRRETDGTDYSIPLPMALPEELLYWITRYDDEPKRYSIGFLGSTAGDERRRIAEALSTIYPDFLLATTAVPSDTNTKPEGRRSRDDYYRQLQQCRIVLSLPGAGYDTFRFWENSACNAVHLAPEMPLLIPNDFLSDQHIRRFNIGDDLLRRQADSVLECAKSVQEMIIVNRQHLIQHHLTTARATYFIEKSSRALNLQVK
ncbi:MAG: hypothetical protein QNJ22_21845 [Desulfosarcinaceae bacterium]|nr:hypothetical protein [Desulfosarcinaceae bacterium]